MSFKVIKFFTDLQDKDHPYKVDAPYPRKGLNPTQERIAQLLGSDNKQGVPLIVEVADGKAQKAAAKGSVKKVE